MPPEGKLMQEHKAGKGNFHESPTYTGARLSGESASSCSSWGRMFSMLSHTEGTILIAVPNRTAIIRASEGRASSSTSLFTMA